MNPTISKFQTFLLPALAMIFGCGEAAPEVGSTAAGLTAAYVSDTVRLAESAATRFSRERNRSRSIERGHGACVRSSPGRAPPLVHNGCDDLRFYALLKLPRRLIEYEAACPPFFD